MSHVSFDDSEIDTQSNPDYQTPIRLTNPNPPKIAAMDFLSESLKTAFNPAATITPRATGQTMQDPDNPRPRTPRSNGGV